MRLFFHQKRVVFLCLLICLSFVCGAQGQGIISGTAPLYIISDLSEETIDWDVQLKVIRKAPAPVSDYGHKKAYLRSLRKAASAAEGGRSSVPPPASGMGFSGNIANSIPNDNHLAISDSGKILSVVNTNLRVYDENGTFITGKSLATFSGLGLQANTSDPRALYDPVADRFILLFFSGSSSSNSRIIIGFSKTNDPSGAWNVYRLSGCPLNDSTWSDYPIVTHNEHDLFFTFNHVGDGQGWQNGFRYSAVWQVQKQEGYAGDTLQYNYFHHVQHNGQVVRSICPVQSGMWSGNTASYFLSVRPTDLLNDTVFLHTISSPFSSGNATLTTRALRTDLPYGMPPDARQSDSTWLATNDARVLSAVWLSNEIRWMQNSVHLPDGRAGIYAGRLLGASDPNPVLTGQLIISDTAEYGYPALSVCGSGPSDRRCMMTCSYQPDGGYPGTAAFFVDQFGEYSPMLSLRSGDGPVSFFQDSVMRWGDYNGIQPRFNQPFRCWLSGSYGKSNGDYGTWIAEVVAEDTLFTTVPVRQSRPLATVFPNPARETFALRFTNESTAVVRVHILDMQGRLIYRVFEHDTRSGELELSFFTGHLSSGQYVVEASRDGELIAREKLIIQ